MNEPHFKVDDAEKDLEVILGGDNSQHSLKVNGRTWNKVRALEISTDVGDVGGYPLIRFECFLDDMHDFVGRFTPQDRRESFDVALRFGGRDHSSALIVAGKRRRFIAARLYPQVDGPTMLEIDYYKLTIRGREPEKDSTKGVFLPVGEQRIDVLPDYAEEYEGRFIL